MIKRPGGHKCNGSYHGHFTTLLLEPTKKKNGRRRVWRLRDDFDATIHFVGGTMEISVPSGFETDLASIPLVAQVFLGGRDTWAEESVIHDFLCVNRSPAFFTNSVMRIVMELQHRSKWKTLAIYYALVFFGYGSATFNFFTLGKFRRDAQVQSKGV